ncbi:alpha/beta hydrolase [Pontibacter rugosus]|uniref:Alpha/beta hydrolase n=1 Tax=Pontibacter rugosus TaxID=1745966 RepID=A0ABW3SLJ6_9BACT
MKIKKNLLVAALPLVAAAVAYKWSTWKTDLVKAVIKRQKDKGDYKRFIKNYPGPPESLQKKYAFEKIDINGARGYWINKAQANKGVLVYLHGGGYVFGPLEVQWKYIARMSEEMGMAAVVIDYKMAPEHPFPAGLQDVEKIITTLQAEGAIPETYYILGDSAGGGMAVAITNVLMEKKAALPKKLILMSPWLDLSMSNPAIKFTAYKDIMLPLEEIKRSANKYVPNRDFHNPLVSPMYGNVKDLPPILIQIGTAETFLWDNRKFVQRLTEAQVEVQYEEYPDMFHVFALIHILKEGKQALKSQIEFLA